MCENGTIQCVKMGRWNVKLGHWGVKLRRRRVKLGQHHCKGTLYNHAQVYSVILFRRSRIRRTHVRLAVTYHLHFGPNDRDLFCGNKVERIGLPNCFFYYCSLLYIKRSLFNALEQTRCAHVACDWLMIAYIAIFSALLSRLTVLACDSTWVTSIIALCFLFLCFEYPRSGVLTALV